MFKVSNENKFRDLIYTGNQIIEEGELVYILLGPILDKPTRTSIQIGPDKHIEDDHGQYINHSCDPSVEIVGSKLIALTPINHGDSITFNYNRNEDFMANPFKCNCCQGLIRGKSVLPWFSSVIYIYKYYTFERMCL